MAAKLRPGSSGKISLLRLAYSAPAPDNSNIEELRRLTLPATKALPFVKLRANDQPTWRPENYWQVEPAGKRDTQVKLGRRHAQAAIAAMKADRNSHLIACIVQDIIADAVAPTTKNGHSKRSAVAFGFLLEISETLAAGR